jgi:hypothetical protein
MFEAIEARPFSIVSGVTPRLDCRICTIEWTADSGFETSWQTPASMNPSEARRWVCASAGARRLAAARRGLEGLRASSLRMAPQVCTGLFPLISLNTIPGSWENAEP